jgi:catechol 2,3-dioxygenase
LHVGDIEEAFRFYRAVVGFEVMTQFPSAAFVAAGGYHHHLGLNTWRGEGVPPAPEGVVGLHLWTWCCRSPPTWTSCARGCGRRRSSTRTRATACW